DLHDATGQALTAIRLNLQLLQAASGDPAAVAERTRSTVALVDTAIDEIRRAVNRLGPAIVQDVGLWTAVQAHCRDVGERSRLAIECSIECPNARPSPAVETSAYRIVQEALHNAVRHARPSQVSVRFAAQGDRLQLEVDNDGVAPGEDATQSGFGLVAMRERAEVLGGSFAVERPSPDRCRVRVELPLLAASETDAGARAAWIRG
ncbi:MAG: sensor histidine kinase, partial [Polyangiales bacterium]